MKGRFFVGLCVICMLSFGACSRSAPILNIHNSAYSGGRVPAAKLNQVQKAIVEAGAELGWIMSPAGRGRIVATLNVRSHMAVVDIFYSPDNYSIVYKDSSNLNYANGRIHKNYNGWIQNLSNGIRLKIAAAGLAQ